FFSTVPFTEAFSNLLVAPAARFDSAWYLAIAQHGYEVGGRSAFFPAFPGLVRIGGELSGSPLVAGIALSSACGLGGLYLLHRLVALDFGVERARTVVWLAAWFPGAMVLSAVYSESLFLLVSVGAIYAARLDRWALAGMLGAVAAATRSGGVIVIVPLLIIYLYAHRRPRADVLWVLLGVPAGLAAYVAYLGLTTGDPTSVFTAQAAWGRSFVPLGGVALGLWSAVQGALELIVPGFGRSSAAFAHGVPTELIDIRDIAMVAFLAGGIWLCTEAVRRLHPSYAAYAVCGLALPLSVPAAGFPLMSLPRFEFVIFPLWIALALWADERRRVRQLLWLFGTLLAISSAFFSVWALAP
ncbi:MAG TPA: mannosyltransferase family protein, partial [Solirubrobacterales bacterium]|nr:mannosyltransferase family protein [Solirubrobacterales bacterium]